MSLLPNRSAAPDREVHLRDYWSTAWRGRWTVLAVFLTVVAAVAAYSFLKTPVYMATASVEVQPQARRIAPGQDVSGIGVAGYGWFAEEKYQNTQIEIVRSRAVAEKAFEDLGLATDPRFSSRPDPVGAFQALIKVEPRRETGLIEISISGIDRQEITRWVNVVAQTYVARNLDRARENAESAVRQIKKMMEPLRGTLEQAESSRVDVLKESQIYNPENQAQIVKQRLEQLNKEMNTTQLEVARLKALLDKISELQTSGASPLSIPELAEDKVLQGLSEQKIQVERQIEATRVTFRPGAPAYQEKVQELEKIKSRIRDQIAVNLGNIQNRHDLALRNMRNLQTEIAQGEDESLRLGVATSKYDLVKTDADTKQALYQAITKTLNEITVSAELLSNNVTLLDRAVPPLTPVAPNKRINLLLGAIVGLFLGVATVFFIDYLDNTLRSPEDVEKLVGLTTLAVVPRFSKDEAMTQPVREAHQSLRTSLIFSSKNRERRVVLVSSTGPQEGKSSTVAQLARTMASAGDRVIVLDCDLRRPTQHLLMGVERDRGITNFLVGSREESWTSYVKPVGPSNLHVMTCGAIPPNPPELLGSERFRLMLNDLRAVYDWILVDSPPSATIADARLLTALADMVVLVIRHNSTDRDHVRRTVGAFRAVNASLAGVVLNDVDIAKASRRDYYYAGYYYYASDGEPGRKKKSAPAREKVGTDA